METRFENDYRVSKKYPCFVDYTEVDFFAGMPKLLFQQIMTKRFFAIDNYKWSY